MYGYLYIKGVGKDLYLHFLIEENVKKSVGHWING